MYASSLSKLRQRPVVLAAQPLAIGSSHHGPVGPVLEHVVAAPGPALRPYVARLTGYREAGLTGAVHRGLPSPYLTFIVTLDEPVDIAAHPDPQQRPSRHGVLLGGLHTAPALIQHDGRQAGVQVEVHPLACRALFGLPAGELAHRDLDAQDVLGRTADELHERVRTATTWPARLAAVESVLLRQADRARGVAPEVRYAWARLVRTGGRLPVAELADETGWSARHLSARFGVELGLSPKEAARVARFDRARRALQRTGPGRLAELAADTGYADQAHLAREFRALAGCPPSAWWAEEGRPAG